jgi:hypothetical protein
MSNKDILDYLASLRQKVMFRYQIKKEDVAKPGK